MKSLIQFILFLIIPLSGFSSDQKPIPFSWSKGEPIWVKGERLPPEGMSLIVICARKGGTRRHQM